MTDNSASASGSAPITASFQIVVGLIAGAIIADQIESMRIVAIGTWTHFGSFVISVAMVITDRRSGNGGPSWLGQASLALISLSVVVAGLAMLPA